MEARLRLIPGPDPSRAGCLELPCLPCQPAANLPGAQNLVLVPGLPSTDPPPLCTSALKRRCTQVPAPTHRVERRTSGRLSLADVPQIEPDGSYNSVSLSSLFLLAFALHHPPNIGIRSTTIPTIPPLPTYPAYHRLIDIHSNRPSVDPSPKHNNPRGRVEPRMPRLGISPPHI